MTGWYFHVHEYPACFMMIQIWQFKTGLQLIKQKSLFIIMVFTVTIQVRNTLEVSKAL